MLSKVALKQSLISIYIIFALITMGFSGLLAFLGFIDHGGYSVQAATLIVDPAGNGDYQTIKEAIEKFNPHAILITGGTGISPKDVTIEAIRPMFTKELTAFGSLFAYLSFEDIDAAALLSRATAGLIDRTIVFCMPGSLKACKLACNELIFPELGHVVKHARHG